MRKGKSKIYRFRMRIKERFEKRPLFQQFTAAFIMLVFIPIICVSMISYYNGVLQIRKQYEQFLLQATKSINETLQNTISELDWMMLQIANQDQTKEFAMQSPENYYEIYKMKKWCDSQIFLKRLLTDHKYVGRISIVGDSGIEYSFYGDEAQEYDKNLYDHSAIVEKAAMYREILPTDGRCIFFLSRLKEDSSTIYLTAARRFSADSDFNMDGTIFVEIQAAMLQQMISNINVRGGSVWILNEKNDIVYQTDPDKIGKQVSDYLDLSGFSENQGSYVSRQENQRVFITYNQDSLMGWTSFIELPLSQMEAPIQNVRIIVSFLLLIALPMTCWLVYQFTRSTQDNLEKRKAQLQALQTQINPHFLYNTLGAVNTYAMAAEQPEIEQMVGALSSMFRYAVQDALEPVRLADEVVHVEHYLKIMWYRYRIMPQIIWDVDSCLEESILRLTIQPLLENVFQHAFSNRSIQESDYILIRAKKKEGAEVIVDVEDSGSGIPGLQEGRIYHLSQVTGVKFGIGLTNVNRRIQMVYGENYGITMFRNQNGGSTIRLSLPCAEDKKNSAHIFMIIFREIRKKVQFYRK